MFRLQHVLVIVAGAWLMTAVPSHAQFRDGRYRYDDYGYYRYYRYPNGRERLWQYDDYYRNDRWGARPYRRYEYYNPYQGYYYRYGPWYHRNYSRGPWQYRYTPWQYRYPNRYYRYRR